MDIQQLYLLFAIFLILINGGIIYRLSFIHKLRPLTIENAQFKAELKVGKLPFYIMLLGLLNCILTISNLLVQVLTAITLGLMVAEQVGFPFKKNEIVADGEKLFIIERNRIVEEFPFNKLKKIIVHQKKIELYSDKFERAIAFKEPSDHLLAFKALLNIHHVKVFEK